MHKCWIVRYKWFNNPMHKDYFHNRQIALAFASTYASQGYTVSMVYANPDEEERWCENA